MEIFACRHVPWYIDPATISEEEKYYLDSIDNKYPEALWSKMNKENLDELNNKSQVLLV